MNPDSTSDQKNAQAEIDPDVTHGPHDNLIQGNRSRLKDPPPQSSAPNPDGSPNQPPDISCQHKTPVKGDLSGSGTSPPEDEDANASPPDFFEQEGPHHPSPVPAANVRIVRYRLTRKCSATDLELQDDHGQMEREDITE